MNIKSYLKGIGVGIIVASLVLIIAGNMNKMSDADVIKRAKELGMVEANAAKENTVDASDNSAAAANTTEASAEDKTAPNTSDTNNTNVNASDNSSINTSEDSKTNTSEISSLNATEDSKASNTVETSTDASEDNKTDTSSSEATNDTSTSQNADNKTGETVKVEVKSGMSSESVSLAVKNAGLVDNDMEFNKYLCENGYDKRLRVGTFDIPSGSDFETISKYLCGIK